jgi:glycosyltransferase involved in cell wall biosynthesis
MHLRISAVVPTYNSEKIIKECLDSLTAQTHPFDEIIIVDNASTDRTREIIGNYPFRKILLERNMERCVSRNTGWRAAQNELVAIIENDSVYDKHWVEKALECIEKGADAVVDRRGVYKPETFISRMNDEFFGVRMLKNKYTPYSAWVFKKHILEELGGYDEGQVGFEDMELGKRLIKNGYNIAYQPDAVSYHAGEPATLKQEMKRSWWFGVRAHKYYSKYPEEFPYARFIFYSVLTLSILLPYAFIILLSGTFILLFLKFISMKMKTLYAAAESALSIMRHWVFFIAYIASSIDKQKRR